MSTQIKVEFNLIGENFSPENFTKQLGINPTLTYVKGEKVHNRKNLYRKECCWEYSTENEESLDVSLQFNKIVKIVQPKINVIKLLVKENDLKAKLCIIINIGDITPAIYLEQEHIEFLHKMNATLDIDCYVNEK